MKDVTIFSQLSKFPDKNLSDFLVCVVSDLTNRINKLAFFAVGKISGKISSHFHEIG